MKVIIFGLGNYYQIQRPKLASLTDIEIVAFADNNAELWDKNIDERRVISPAEILSKSFDKLIIVSLYVSEIYHQLVSLGVDRDRIISWPHFWSERMKGKMEIYEPEMKCADNGGKVLIISNDLDYNGASLAAVYAAKALIEHYYVVLAVPLGNEKLIRETVNDGITVAVCAALPWLGDREQNWMKQFDVVLVNTYPMIESALGVRENCPVLWWLHESSGNFPIVKQQYPEGVEGKEFKDIKICAVSEIAWHNFNKVHPEWNGKVLPLGIPDKMKKWERRDVHKVIFTLIGGICPGKGQDYFLNAIERLGNRESAEFWLIGGIGDNEYCRKIRKKAEEIGAVKLLGERTRAEMDYIFQEIDVVVCASQEETLSIAVIEGMMSGKICIATNSTGIAHYIDDNRNGFLVEYGNTDVLAKRMGQIIADQRGMQSMREAARETYEKYFSMEAFSGRLEEMICETKREWRNESPVSPKITVLLPSLNVAAYIRECIESVIIQTLRDIEILCIDAGSTDGTCEIIQEYAAKDSRIRFVPSEKRSYGYQVNLGIDMAKGEYIGIVETDDCIEPDMYEVLYQTAVEKNLDYVKAGFYTLVTPYEGEQYLLENPLGDTGQIFSSQYFMEKALSPDVYIWNGIYRLSFLREFHIRLNESPGAAFQDCGFRYMVDMNVRRGMFIDSLFYRYRRDNAAASTYSTDFVRYNLEECRYIRKRMREIGIIDRKRLAFMARETVMMALSPYMTFREHSQPNEKILSDLNQFREILWQDRAEGRLRQEEMLLEHWIELRLFTEQPEAYEAYIAVRAKAAYDIYGNFVQEMAAKKQFVIFCTGKAAKYALCLLRMNRLENMVAFCDNNQEKWGSSFYGYDVLSPKEAVRRYPDAHYLIAKVNGQQEIIQQLIHYQIPRDRISIYKLPLNAFGSTNLFMRP
ncbi:hypothetical protein C804_01157 [Lachnospiraceae bacterium A4]|nr:hypothetical protein C804_01157 [Lachnospiraceae bacterium A4]